MYGEFVPRGGPPTRANEGYGADYHDYGGYPEEQQQYYDEYGNPLDYSGQGDANGAEAPSEVEEGVWALQVCAAYDMGKVTSLEYDDFYERLWMGQANGRVTGLVFDTDPTGVALADRYCSFLASKEPVVKVIPQGQFILSLNRSVIKMHTDGGLPLAGIDAPESIDAGTATFTCGAVAQRGQQASPHILAGTSHTYALLYDLQSMSSSPVLSYDVASPSCCCLVTSQHVVFAGQDGKLRLLDGRLRSGTVQHVLEAHSGPVHDVAVSPDGLTLVTCGAIGRSNNLLFAHKTKPDPLVRIFDLRTNRQLAPMTMTTGSPHTLRFLSPPDIGSSSSSSLANPYRSPRILMGAHNGLVQISDPSPVQDPSHTQILYAPLTDQREHLTAAAVSSSGHLVAVATSAGTIAQYAVGLHDVSEKQRVNASSAELAVPPSLPPPPLLSLAVESPVVGTSYCLNPRPPPPDQFEEPTASSFASTPRLLERKLRLSSARRISPALLRNLSQQDFVGFVPNPGFLLNTLLHADPVNGTRAYAVSDPRKLEASGGAGAGAGAGIGAGGGGGGGSTLADGSAEQARDPTSQSFSVNPEIPTKFLRHASHRGKQRMTAFNYAQFNATTFVGLENAVPNSYTNPLLLLMSLLPEVVAVAFSAQTSHYHHHTPTTLWVELGFLFHMMRVVEKEAIKGKATERVVTPANFQRTFQQVPEAVALELFDGSQTNPQVVLQTFAKFLLQQLHRESELESRPPSEARSVRALSGAQLPSNRSYSAVDEVFGHTLLSQTTFLVSNTMETGAPIRAFSLDLVYPSPKASAALKVANANAAAAAAAAASGAASSDLNDSQGRPLRLPKPAGLGPSFSVAVWGSLRKETSMRGWCNASAAYEPFKQVRSMTTLPRVMALNCGDTTRDPKEATVSGALGEAQTYGSMHHVYWSARSHLGGAWLPVELEVCVLHAEGGGGVGRLVVSALLLPPAAAATEAGSGAEEGAEASKKAKAEAEYLWVIYDGLEECIAQQPASRIPHYNITPRPPPSPSTYPQQAPERAAGWERVSMRLMAVVSQVVASMPQTAASSSSSSSSTAAAPSASTSTGGDARAALAASAPAAGAAGATAGPVGDKHVILHIRDCIARPPPAPVVSPKPPPAPVPLVPPTASAAAVAAAAATAAAAAAAEAKAKAEAEAREAEEGAALRQHRWMMFNDFRVEASDSHEATSFPSWRHPCAVFFARTDYRYSFPTRVVATPLVGSVPPARPSLPSQPSQPSQSQPQPMPLPFTLPASGPQATGGGTGLSLSLSGPSAAAELPHPGPSSPSAPAAAAGEFTAVPPSVLLLPSLSSIPSVRLNSTTMPGRGALVAFDGEFVSVELERAVVSARGARVVAAESRQVLARMSLVEGGLVGLPPETLRVLVDDYILPSEAIVDYVTRFSGIVAEDLQPAVSRHAVVTNRTAYLKLRFFVDRGCCFVGHGLQKDFETANIVVPSDQVIDTVELWRLPAQRKISLRFLASYLLRANIQDEVHDSIEDAKTALALYRHYEAIKAQGPAALQAVLDDLYAYGTRCNWVIGL